LSPAASVAKLGTLHERRRAGISVIVPRGEIAQSATANLVHHHAAKGICPGRVTIKSQGAFPFGADRWRPALQRPSMEWNMAL